LDECRQGNRHWKSDEHIAACWFGPDAVLSSDTAVSSLTRARKNILGSAFSFAVAEHSRGFDSHRPLQSQIGVVDSQKFGLKSLTQAVILFTVFSELQIS